MTTSTAAQAIATIHRTQSIPALPFPPNAVYTNQPMMTPPMPHRMVSQIGMLSLSPGATNLPSSPMMMPAMMTPMISSASPSQSGRLGEASL